MKPFITIRQASASYPVYVGRDLLSRVGELAEPRGRVFVITSQALRERFGHRVAASFEPRGCCLQVASSSMFQPISPAPRKRLGTPIEPSPTKVKEPS